MFSFVIVQAFVVQTVWLCANSICNNIDTFVVVATPVDSSLFSFWQVLHLSRRFECSKKLFTELFANCERDLDHSHHYPTQAAVMQRVVSYSRLPRLFRRIFQIGCELRKTLDIVSHRKTCVGRNMYFNSMYICFVDLFTSSIEKTLCTVYFFIR